MERIPERDRDLSALRTFLERLLDLLSVGDLDLLPDGVPPLLYGVVDLLGIALGFRTSLRVNCRRRNSFSLLSFSSSETTDDSLS